MSIQELIRNNEAHIWMFRWKFPNIVFLCGAIHEFLIDALYVFEQTVYPQIVNINSPKDILTFYKNLLNEYLTPNKVIYYSTRIAAAMQSREYKYVLETCDYVEKDLIETLERHHELSEDSNVNPSIAYWENDLKTIKEISKMISNGEEYYINSLLEERISYWDDMFHKKYSSFYN